LDQRRRERVTRAAGLERMPDVFPAEQNCALLCAQTSNIRITMEDNNNNDFCEASTTAKNCGGSGGIKRSKRYHDLTSMQQWPVGNCETTQQQQQNLKVRRANEEGKLLRVLCTEGHIDQHNEEEEEQKVEVPMSPAFNFDESAFWFSIDEEASDEVDLDTEDEEVVSDDASFDDEEGLNDKVGRLALQRVSSVDTEENDDLPAQPQDEVASSASVSSSDDEDISDDADRRHHHNNNNNNKARSSSWGSVYPLTRAAGSVPSGGMLLRSRQRMPNAPVQGPEFEETKGCDRRREASTSSYISGASVNTSAGTAASSSSKGIQAQLSKKRAVPAEQPLFPRRSPYI